MEETEISSNGHCSTLTNEQDQKSDINNEKANSTENFVSNKQINSKLMASFSSKDIPIPKELSMVQLNNLTFQDLLAEIRHIFQGDRVDIDYLKKILTSYKSNRQDWQKYAHYDRFRYTRNLVEDHEKYNIMILNWAEGQGSSIHDHSGSHCFMKVIDGTLKETQFEWPEKKPINNNGNDIDNNNDDDVQEMKLACENILNTNEVTYINDHVGLHRVENPSHMETAASLHVYIPPYRSCKTFDQRTGHAREVQVTFYSKNGNVYTEPENN